MSIPILIPTVPTLKSIAPFLERIDESRRYSNYGPLEQELRGVIAGYIGCDPQNVATAANATVAIQGAIQASGFVLNKWNLPSWTFAASAAASINSGAAVRFVDIQPDWRAKFEDVESCVVDVLPFGDDLEPSRYVNRPSSVVDAAASIGSLRNSFSQIRDLRVFVIVSMHATKLIPAGEGSFVFSGDADWINRFRAWTNFGFQNDRQSNSIGTNGKLSEYSAAVGLASFKESSGILSRYKTLADKFLKLTTDFGYECHPAMKKGLVTPYWIIETSSPREKSNMVELAKKWGIETRDWWGKGCHAMPAFQNVEKNELAETKRVASQSIGLPFHLYLNDDDILVLAKFLAECRAKVS